MYTSIHFGRSIKPSIKQYQTSQIHKPRHVKANQANTTSIQQISSPINKCMGSMREHEKWLNSSPNKFYMSFLLLNGYFQSQRLPRIHSNMNEPMFACHMCIVAAWQKEAPTSTLPTSILEHAKAVDKVRHKASRAARRLELTTFVILAPNTCHLAPRHQHASIIV